MQKSFVSVASVLLLLTGCSQLPDVELKFNRQQNMDTHNKAKVKNNMQSSEKLQAYLRQLGQELINNVNEQQLSPRSTRVAVTSFVPLQGDFGNSDVEGMQIQESLIYEMYHAGIDVIDYKATDFIRVTPKGDFALTRDYMDIKNKMNVSHVVVGTLTKHADNMIINSRLVTVKDKKVVSVAQVIIPEDVIDDFYLYRGKMMPVPVMAEAKKEEEKEPEPTGVQVSFTR